jgi:hypothetical protein
LIPQSSFGTILAHTARFNAAFGEAGSGEATQAALTKILPVEEDRFGK